MAYERISSTSAQNDSLLALPRGAEVSRTAKENAPDAAATGVLQLSAPSIEDHLQALLNNAPRLSPDQLQQLAILVAATRGRTSTAA